MKQYWNPKLGIDRSSEPVSNVIFEKYLHILKQASPRRSTDDGMQIDRNDVQFSKPESVSNQTWQSGSNITRKRLWHCEKHPPQAVFVLFPIVISSTDQILEHAFTSQIQNEITTQSEEQIVFRNPNRSETRIEKSERIQLTKCNWKLKG
jgi:hypothetical protein